MRKKQDNIQLDLSGYDGFNDIYFDLTELHHDKKHTYIVNMGGGGSGKSHATAQMLAIESTLDKSRGLIIRKVAATLKDSVMPLIFEDIMEDLGLESLWSLNKSDKELTNINHGGKMLFRGLDDPEKLKSITGIDWMWIEEASELDENDWKVINDRIRGNPKIYLTFNPVSEKHWLKKVFYDSDKPRTKILHTTYLNNLRFVGEKYIREMEWYKIHDPDHHRVYGLGLWGIVRTGTEWFRAFSREKHVRKLVYNPNEPVHLTFDFNNRPYMTLLVRQIDITNDRITAKTIGEICLEHPKNSTEDLCREFLRIFEPHGIASVYFYGDASGKNKNAKRRSEDGDHHYDIVQEMLIRYCHNYSDRVFNKNPSLVKSRDFYSRLLNGFYSDIEWYIDAECTNLIHDLETLVEDISGGFIKKKVKDEFGNVYEEGGHCADALRYSDVFIFQNLFENY